MEKFSFALFIIWLLASVLIVLLEVYTCLLIRRAIKLYNPDDHGLLEILAVLFIPAVGFYLAENKLTEAYLKNRIPHKNNANMYLILGFIGFGIVDLFLFTDSVKQLEKYINT